MKKINFLYVALIFSGCVWSSPFPIVTSVTPEFTGMIPNNQYTYKYHITQSIIDIGPAGDYIPPYGTVVSLGHRHEPTSVPGSGQAAAQTQYFSDGKSTVSALGMTLYNIAGKNVDYVMHNGSQISTYECVAYYYDVTGADMSHYGVWANMKTPGGCLNVPPVDKWCKITSPEILLDHGTLTLQDAEGSSVNKGMNVECVGDMAVSFRLVTDDSYIYLDDGQSAITVDNKPLGSKVELPEGQSVVTIKDMLTGVKTEGVHAGSSVLVMMPY